MANELVIKLLDGIVDSLDIPESYYQRAANRHRSLGEWLCRPESKVAIYNPHITPQGSFRYGTVTRPLNADGEYDLGNVVTLYDAQDSDDSATVENALWCGDSRIC